MTMLYPNPCYNEVFYKGTALGMFALSDMSRDMRFPTMWYVRPAKAQTSLRICAVLSESSLVA